MNKSKILIISAVSIISVATLGMVAIPLLTNNREEFKHDNVIEIWTTNSSEDQFFNTFNEQFVEEFNKTSNYEVNLVTVTPQESLASDISIKMQAKGNLPNMFIGYPDDAIFLAQSENDFAQLMDISEYSNSLILSNYAKYNDKFQGKEIIPYAPLMVKGEALYVNNLQMNSFIKLMETETSVSFSSDFKELFNYNEEEVNDIYFDTSKLDGNDALNNFMTKYPVIDVDIFETYEGLISLSVVINSLLINESNYSIGLDDDVNSAESITYNMVGNDYSNWMFNTENELNFIDSSIAQESYSNFVDFYQKLIRDNAMWVRTDDNTNPTVPFVQDQLTMFVGANFNAKYINSNNPDEIQYDEATIISAPNRVFESQDEMFVFTSPKTINAISFGSEEDTVTGEFIDFVLNDVSEDYGFYINEGYLPPVTNLEDFELFREYLNDDSNFIETSDKQKSLINSLRATANSVSVVTSSEDGVMFTIPQLETTLLFDEFLFESNRKENGDEAVKYLITQLETYA